MESYDLAIIGTGSGNSILDDRYANKRVAICEQGTFGGTCLNVGCIPTKMFVYAAEVAETIRAASRYGIDAHIDRVRWDDIVSRVFGRIDPIAIGGEDYRRAQPNIDVYDTHTRFAAVAGRRPLSAAHRRRRGVHRRKGGDRCGCAGRGSAGHPGLRGALLHQRRHHADSGTAQASGDRRWWLRGMRVRAHLLRARGPDHDGDPRRLAAAASWTTPCPESSPASRRASGKCAATATFSARTRTAPASCSNSTTARS